MQLISPIETLAKTIWRIIVSQIPSQIHYLKTYTFQALVLTSVCGIQQFLTQEQPIGPIPTSLSTK